MQLGGTRNRAVFHEHLKRLSKSAALHSKSVILLVHEDMGDECLEDVCDFVKQGIKTLCKLEKLPSFGRNYVKNWLVLCRYVSWVVHG